MKTNRIVKPSFLRDLEVVPPNFGVVILNKERFVEILKEADAITDLTPLKNKVIALKGVIAYPKSDGEGILNIDSNGDTIEIGQRYLFDQLNQIAESQTLERAKYYVERLVKALTEVRTSKINDINLNRWKEHDDIRTDSLWIMDKRDSSGVHTAGYWGNFIPQIPNQMLKRYTKKGDWVLDPFVGCGTTLIESQRLGRNGIGVDLQETVAQKREQLASFSRY